MTAETCDSVTSRWRRAGRALTRGHICLPLAVAGLLRASVHTDSCDVRCPTAPRITKIAEEFSPSAAFQPTLSASAPAS